MSGFISFPQVMGHEVVAVVDEAGPRGGWVRHRPAGRAEPVAVVPAARHRARCAPRARSATSACAGTSPTADSAPGIHTGNSTRRHGWLRRTRCRRTATMLIPVPDDVPDEVAVFADPFAVSLHAITRHPPPPGGKVLVCGAGALGTTTCRDPAGAVPRRRGRGRRPVRRAGGAGPQARRARGRRQRAARAGARGAGGMVRRRAAPDDGRTPGLPMCHPGGIDVVYDTVGKPETFEVERAAPEGAGHARARAACTLPGRWEWSPLVLQGDLAGSAPTRSGSRRSRASASTASPTTSTWSAAGRIDLTGMLTHTFRLDRLARGVPHDRRTRHHRRHQGRLRLPLTPNRFTTEASKWVHRPEKWPQFALRSKRTGSAAGPRNGTPTIAGAAASGSRRRFGRRSSTASTPVRSSSLARCIPRHW